MENACGGSRMLMHSLSPRDITRSRRVFPATSEPANATANTAALPPIYLAEWLPPVATPGRNLSSGQMEAPTEVHTPLRLPARHILCTSTGYLSII